MLVEELERRFPKGHSIYVFTNCGHLIVAIVEGYKNGVVVAKGCLTQRKFFAHPDWIMDVHETFTGVSISQIVGGADPVVGHS